MSQDESNPSGIKSDQSSIGIGLVIVLILVVVGISWGLGQKLKPIPQAGKIDAPISPTIAPEKEVAKVSPPEKETRETPPPVKNEAVPPKVEKKPGEVPSKPKPPVSAVPDPYKIRNLTLKNVDGKVIYRGEMDLRPEIARIKEGEKLPFSHDGTIFQNREGRLPKKGEGYYREWVVLTPGQSGPGPQRIITGKGGEMYYTFDHYRTFQKLP
ncbi:MAG: ribonuclease domain-containing protein [Planctomycetales bacterium]